MRISNWNKNIVGLALALSLQATLIDGFSLTSTVRRNNQYLPLFSTAEDISSDDATTTQKPKKQKAVVIGAGWGGLSAAYSLSQDPNYEVTVVDAAPRVGGLVRDGFRSMTGERKAEAGQHGFWDQYYNIFKLLKEDLGIFDSALTDYAEQGQYSPDGLEAVWPVYRDQTQLPTGLAQAAYTKFLNLPKTDLLTAFPLVLAFSEFDDSPESWEKFDKLSFRELCVKLGVSKRCYEEAFEPMILTGLFAPGVECSAAAAMGMAYFFVLSNQKAFDVRWCKGNIGEQIFDPWVDRMRSQQNPVNFQSSTRVNGFNLSEEGSTISSIKCVVDGEKEVILEADHVVFAVGAAALNAIVRNSPELSTFAEYRRFANLRGTSVLATRVFLDREVKTAYTANACWGFDQGVGMTYFDVKGLHKENFSDEAPGSVLEVDYYHADTLLVMSDDALVKKVKEDLNTILGLECETAKVVDAAIVRLPNAVNWYFPDSYKDMPDVQSQALSNVYFSGDLVRTRHGSWSQEKAYVTGIEASNCIRGKNMSDGVIPLPKDEPHVALGRTAVSQFRTLLGAGEKSRAPSIVDFLPF
mmetsp:Transcript_4236/g.4652  ORF Transcript_4236/g.4652 Transcript_4236/m.4652 type:complete len:581 (-) Transcript_4236:417-2159(-)